VGSSHAAQPSAEPRAPARDRERKQLIDGKISIVVPLFESERFLGEAIESVLAQTYADWELLLVDDGSTDASAAIAAGYAARDARISCLAHPGHERRGNAEARNLGIAHAGGGYVAFLDADDVWLPRKLEQQTAILAAHPDAAMVYGLSQWWYSWTGHGEDLERDFVHPLGVQAAVLLEPPSLLRPFFVLQEAAIPNPSSIMLRRSAFQELGGFEHSFRGVYVDQAFYAKVLSRAAVVASDECWDRYRQHPDSITTRIAARGEAEAVRAEFLGWLVEYLTGAGVGDAKLLGELRRQRFRCAHPRLSRVAGSVTRGG
jgi:glycosyltransferase involved in cell wall biosynthesis